MDSVSGVGVLDKALAVLGAVEGGARTLADVVDATGLSRSTAHRLVAALEAHGLARRDDEGRYSLGLRLIGLGHAASEALPGWLDARPELAWLREQTGESVQLFVRDGDERVCVESLEAPHELRTIVPVGARAGGPCRARRRRRVGSRASPSGSRAWRRSVPRSTPRAGGSSPPSA